MLDQFSRVIHRGTPLAFAQDACALNLSLEAIAIGIDEQLTPIERVFMYMPLEHAEDLDHQESCLHRMRWLVATVASSSQEPFTGFVDYAERHREVIARFGRFPHRNAILGRTSTPEELAFLEQPGSRF